MPPKHINPTALAQYIHFENCDRHLRFRINTDDSKRLAKKWDITLQPLTPLLSEAGLDFEANVGAQIATLGEKVIELEDHATPQETLSLITNLRSPTILLQASLAGTLGSADASGRADAIRLERDRRGELHVLIADIKASRQEKTEHRLQVAVYAHMLREMADSAGIKIATLDGAVLTRQDDGSFPALSPQTPTFDLETYFSILERLAILPDCKVNQILAQPFEQVFYHLGYKCDGCLYNALCMYDSAERLDLALTPAISAVEKRVLNENGINTLPQLADLMLLPSNGSYDMRPNPNHTAVLNSLRNRWPVAPNLPFLVQRARAALWSFQKGTESRPFLYGSGFGNLPSDEEHPNLVKIFFDAQLDYLQNRVYLLSALVTGPRGSKEVIAITPAPSTDQSESDILISWITDLLAAIRQVAQGTHAPIHLYSYNRYDQKVLLETLKRHIDDLATIPAFIDLLTQTPALSQSIISFLYDELQEHSNQGMVCLPLHDAARRLKFNWQDDRYDYFSLFRARMFDNRRTVLRDSKGDLGSMPANTPTDDPRRLIIEAASRFNSQIPLEYVYAAWDCLPVVKETRHSLDPFRAVDLDALTAFAGMRVRALAHIEKALKKARFIDKPDMDISALTETESLSDLSLALKEFLYIEHHSSLQEHLLIFSLPVDRRVQSGRSMLLKYSGAISKTEFLFTPEFATLGLDPVLTMNACKLKEGNWVVMNDSTDQSLTANKIKNGRLATIINITPERVVLEFRDTVQGRGKVFGYSHFKSALEPGKLFILDEMVDDLNADKILESLKNVSSNTLYSWFLSRPAARDVTDANFYQLFIGQIDTILSSKKRKLTAAQREIIAGTVAHPLALVQGPPGTGKSYILAWAMLARIAAASVQGRTCRVAVSCKTHNAIKVVLKAIAEARQLLSAFPIPKLGGDTLRSLTIYKLGGDDDDAGNIPGVSLLNYYTEKASLPGILNMPFVIIGATSGGFFNLMKYSSSDGKHVPWGSQPFDLLVVDEASQMSIPEGVLAAAFLNPSGEILVVGDHRQMPPINAHPWKDEEKRNLVALRPYVSLFESLIERDFPLFALDQSFRLHEEIADFLNINIYSKDGINFHSREKGLITQIHPVDPYVDAVLNPSYPIVVIEHTERASQQFNPTELALTVPLVEACVKYLGLDGRSGIGVVVPHRAQKALLSQRFPDLAATRSIDTVERFQGDERDVIIVSATASDPDYVRSEADFLLNLNRLNVAISRPRKKLIVIASRSVIDLLTSDLEVFENAVLWKRLYYHYAPDLLYSDKRDGIDVFVKGRHCKQ